MSQPAEQFYQFQTPDLSDATAGGASSTFSSRVWDELFSAPTSRTELRGEQRRRSPLDDIFEQLQQQLGSQNRSLPGKSGNPELQENGCYSSPAYMNVIDEVASTVYDPSIMGNLKELNHRYDCEIKNDQDAIKYAHQALKFLGDPYTGLMLYEQNFPDAIGVIGVTLGVADATVEAKPDSKGPFVIKKVQENSAAAKAGLKPGDVIDTVDGVKITGKTLEEVANIVRGPGATLLKLGVLRRGEAVDLKIVRAPFKDVEQARPSAETAHRAGVGIRIGLLSKDGKSYSDDFAVPVNAKSNLTERQENDLVITNVTSGSPAERAGLRRGDVIKQIDGKDIAGKDVTYITNTIRGASGRAVMLGVLRDGALTQINIVREELAKTSVVSDKDLGGGAVYIKIEAFEQGLGDQLEAVMNKHKNAKGFILDLRDNPGGLLTEAIESSSIFIWQGPIVTLDNRVKSDPEKPAYSTQRVSVTANTVVETTEDSIKGKRPGTEKPRSAPYMLNGRPVGILINGHSASAAEMFSGALHDNGAAFLIGEKSYGKGIGQQTADAGSFAMRITKFRYYTPKGIWAGDANHNRPGILPDLRVVDDLSAGDPQMDKALEILRKRFK
jgi:C-terminal processing protease CtpA/Prc